MNKIKRSETTTIRVRPDILELADDLCKERGYSRADLFEMGVLLIDNNNENDLVLQKKMYNEMINNFSSLENSIQKDCDKITEKICKEIKKLQSQLNNCNTSLGSKGEEIEEKVVERTISSIIDIIEIRKENINEGILVEPMGKEFFEYKSKTSGIPMDLIISELEKKGYSINDLKNVQMNPEQKWRGYVKLKSDSV